MGSCRASWPLVLCACGRLGFDPPSSDGLASEGLRLTYPADDVAAVLSRTAISLVPTASPDLRFSVAPELPAGLALDPVSGVIAGTPVEVVDEATYTVTGTTDADHVTAALRFTVLPGSVVDATPDTPDDDGGVNEECFSTPAGGCTLRAAVQTANRRGAMQLILLDAKTYPLGGRLEIINNDIEIAGQGAALTVVRAASIHPGFGMLELESNHTVRVKRATFQDFGPSDGAVFHFHIGSLEVDAATFNNNTTGASGSGGVLYIDKGGRAQFRRSTFVGNHAGDWGGVVDGEGALTQIVVDQCTAMGNSAAWGSFSHITTGTTLLLQNSTLYGNTATIAGTLATPGGIYTLVNDTIIHNTNTSADSAGIYLHSAPCTYTVTNTIVAFNTDATGAENNCNRRDVTTELTSRGGNLVSDGAGNCAPYFADGTDHLMMDPGLAAGEPTSNGGLTKTVLLTSGSKAIDGAQALACPAEDQRGQPRSGANGRCDVGAVEMP